MAGRNSQVSRILSILDILDGVPSGLTVAELHTRIEDKGHEAGKRTIYRDLEALQQAGFPLTTDEQVTEKARWRLEGNKKIHQYLVMSSKELFSLYLARGILAPLRDTPFFEDLESLFSKIEEKIGSRQKKYLDEMSDEIKFEPSPSWGLSVSPVIVETIRAACNEGHTISCDYSSVNSGGESKRKLGPHYLYFARGGLYLVAEDLSDQKVKVFAVPRIKNAEMLADQYVGVVSTPEDYFDGALGVFAGTKTCKVSVEFKREVASFVRERRWHSSQRVVGLDGGKVRVHLDVGLTPELISWVLGFGANACVIEPAELREKIAEQAVATLLVYKKSA